VNVTGSRRRWCRTLLAVAALVLSSAGCGGGSSVAPVSSVSGSRSTGPSSIYLAIVSSAADPNALDDHRSALAGRLAPDRATHVVLVQGACYTGIPRRYADRYILALWDEAPEEVRADVATAGASVEWAGEAVVTCLD
jgi:hypothetical protein